MNRTWFSNEFIASFVMNTIWNATIHTILVFDMELPVQWRACISNHIKNNAFQCSFQWRVNQIDPRDDTLCVPDKTIDCSTSSLHETTNNSALHQSFQKQDKTIDGDIKITVQKRMPTTSTSIVNNGCVVKGIVWNACLKRKGSIELGRELGR